MSDMTFFRDGSSIEERTFSFDAAQNSKGPIQTVVKMTQPASMPLQVERVSVRLLAVDWNGQMEKGYLGDFTVALGYGGREYELDYPSLPRAREMRSDQIVHDPELQCDDVEHAFGMSYSLPLLRDQTFVVDPGQRISIRISRTVTSVANAHLPLDLVVLGLLSNEQGILSRRNQLLRRDLNELELESISNLNKVMRNV